MMNMRTCGVLSDVSALHVLQTEETLGILLAGECSTTLSLTASLQYAAVVAARLAACSSTLASADLPVKRESRLQLQSTPENS